MWLNSSVEQFVYIMLVKTHIHVCIMQEDVDTEDLLIDASPFVAVVGSPVDPVQTAVIIERTIVMEDLESFAHGVCIFLGLFYCLNLQYTSKYTYEFLQKVILEIDAHKLSPRVLSFKSTLLDLTP